MTKLTNRIDASPGTVHWGFFDAKLTPLATIESGGTITLSTVSGGPETLPASGFQVPQALRDIHASQGPRLPGHICTGPVEIKGAAPGDVLEVKIQDITFNYDWGYTAVRPLVGALPDDFDEPHIFHTKIDTKARKGVLPWGLELDLAPFFGVMATAPPLAWGAVSTLPPRRNGGNLDNKELVAGTTLYLPVFVPGALFSVGDGHGVQGDGEVCVTAIETGLVGTFELTVRRDMSLEWPMAETPTHLMTMAFDPDLDDCVVIALRQMIDLVVARTGLARHDAFALLSLQADVRVTQVVNGNKGIHVMLEKRLLDFPKASA